MPLPFLECLYEVHLPVCKGIQEPIVNRFPFFLPAENAIPTRHSHVSSDSAHVAVTLFIVHCAAIVGESEM